MAKKVVIESGAFDAALEHLAAAAAKAGSNVKAIGDVCSSVAYLIAGAGSFGGSEQLDVMDRAKKYGFVSDYYAGSVVRVYYPGDYSDDKGG